MADVDMSEDGNPTISSDGFEVLLVTGMSGAGRTHAADSLEDMGWYVVDNLPPNMLIPLVDMMTNSDSAIRKLCAVIDVRSKKYFRGLSHVLDHLRQLGVRTRILFLDCSDQVLVRRYEMVRRPHPLQRGGTLLDGITEERRLLAGLKDSADIVIDTSEMTIHQLSTRLYESLIGKGPTTVSVHIFSFGFKYGLPTDADFVADVRFLPNPYWVPRLRHLTGHDAPVRDYVLKSAGATKFLDDYSAALMTAIDGYSREDKHFVTIAIGCTGGQHRSVVMAGALADRLRSHGLSVTVSDREESTRAAAVQPTLPVQMPSAQTNAMQATRGGQTEPSAVGSGKEAR
jgi:UPF0042 nucleotide-binding protein